MNNALLAILLMSGPLVEFNAFASDISFRDVLTCARHAGVVSAGEKSACFALTEDGVLRELHTRTCGGDPNVEPTRAFFSVKRLHGVITLGYEYGGEDWKNCP